MRKLAFVSLVAVSVAVLVAVAATRGAGPGAAKASSHREAPLISQDPTADNTDLYAFRVAGQAGHRDDHRELDPG